MYFGTMTKELKPLYDKYEKRWGHDPSGYYEADYGDDEYEEYVADIKRALELDVELPDIYPDDDNGDDYDV